MCIVHLSRKTNFEFGGIDYRNKSIPTGFCYQKLILDDETAPILIYHGLNGAFIRELGKWIRLDARGNRENVNAQFSIRSYGGNVYTKK